MNEKPKILVVDDEEIALQNLSYVLGKEGYQVVALTSGEEAIKLLETDAFDLVLTDLRMEKVDGMMLLTKTRELYPDTEVVMITGYATVDSAIAAMKAGAYHYIAKPFKLDEVRKVVREALEKIALKRENRLLRTQMNLLSADSGVITNNRDMKAILKTASHAALCDSNIVLSGESGTGKELLARYIHAASHRRRGPLLAVNCGALGEELLANELFGHEKGAYTGADTVKKGLLEVAEGGTLFLDEITEMSPVMQVKLLRTVQEREIMRVGGTQSRAINVRFITATNLNLQQEVNNGNFRRDLFFRINVIMIHLPSLVERKDDIPLLIQYFLKKYATWMKKGVTEISSEALELLMKYDFPGNVRELENIIERGVALAQGDTIDIEHLAEEIRGLTLKTYRRKEDGSVPSLAEQERSYIQWVLNEAGGNKSLAAQQLGIDRVSLWRKLKKGNTAPSE